jgi:predicted O-methyltransferase YrrM
MNSFDYKIDNHLIKKIDKIHNPTILELGVQNGRSTKKFLEICKKNNGKLYSVDIDDCSNILTNKNWNFFHSRDDNFKFIKSKIENLIDVLFIDTLHEADHVEKLIYGYFDIIKIDGYLFIDDISHLPYLKNSSRNNFYCEINNHETFQRILEIYNNNQDNLELEFSFISSGLAILKKKKNFLNRKKKIIGRNFTIKNFTRCIIKNFLKKKF